jgi:heat shock protein HslJ
MAGLRCALFALIGAILLGCPGASADEPKGAKATSWVLQQGRDIPRRPPRTPKLHLDGKKLSGSTGCNSFTAAVVDKADQRIAIEQVALTRKLCADKLDRIETAFVRALEETAYLERKGRSLTFLSGKREPLLVWTRSKSASRRAVRPRRHARVRQHRRYANVRQHQRRAAFVYRGCWDWLTGAPARRRTRLY